LVWAGATQTAVGVILALVLVNIGINAAKAPLWTMPPMFLSGASAAAGLALINSLGNLGGFIGPYVIGWAKSKWGSYAAGLYVVGGLLALSAVMMLVLSLQSRPPRTLPSA
jgi:ACS family tartrate transporter-like MFS transporter